MATREDRIPQRGPGRFAARGGPFVVVVAAGTATVVLLWHAVGSADEQQVAARVRAIAGRMAQRIDARVAELANGQRRFAARIARASADRHDDWQNDAREFLATFDGLSGIAYADGPGIAWSVPPAAISETPQPSGGAAPTPLAGAAPGSGAYVIAIAVGREPPGALLFRWEAAHDLGAILAGDEDAGAGAAVVRDHGAVVFPRVAPGESAPEESVTVPLRGALAGWTLEFRPSAAWVAAESSPLPRIILAAGLALTALLAYAARASHRLARAAAAERVALERLRASSDEESRSRAMFEGIFENSPDAVLVVGADGQILGVNAQAETMFRAPRAALLGTVLEDLVPAAVRDRHAALRAEFARAPRARRPAEGRRLRASRRDGSEFPAEVALAPVETPGGLAVIAVVRDITEQEASRDALRRSEEHYRRFFEATPAGACTTRPDGTIVSCNRAVAAIFGFPSPVDAVGTDATRLYADPGERQRMLDDLRKDGVVAARRVELRALDGTARSGLLNVSIVLDDAGEFVGMQSHVLDVTEERQLELRLQRAQRLDALGRLAGGIAHDFNNLLTVIGGAAELLMLRPEGASGHALCREILATTARAAALTQQLLVFSAREVVQAVPGDVGDVIRSLEPMLRRVVGEDVVLEVAVETPPGPVPADASQIEQVIMNLVVNAREAMPSGGRLRITVRSDDSEGAERVEVEVADTGEGMPPAVLERIFEPFFTTKDTGTGLGLATVWGIVERAGGTIAVDSEQGRGTTFRIRFPVTSAAAHVPARKPHDDGPVSGRGTVLVVEDDCAVRELIVQILQVCGYTAVAAGSFGEALRVLESPEAIDLLVADVVMPGHGGRDLAEAARVLRPRLPVLYVSGYAEDAILRRRLIDGGDAFLQKPFTPTALACRVAEVLEAASPPLAD